MTPSLWRNAALFCGGNFRLAKLSRYNTMILINADVGTTIRHIICCHTRAVYGIQKFLLYVSSCSCFRYLLHHSRLENSHAYNGNSWYMTRLLLISLRGMLFRQIVYSRLLRRSIGSACVKLKRHKLAQMAKHSVDNESGRELNI